MFVMLHFVAKKDVVPLAWQLIIILIPNNKNIEF